MATFTKAGLATLGRSLSIYIKAGGGIAGDTAFTIDSETGVGIRYSVASGTDTSIHIETGTALRSFSVAGTKETTATGFTPVVSSPPIFPSTDTYPSTTRYPGQGVAPIVRCRIAYDDLSVSIPTWVEVANSDLRDFSISRGRDTEHSEFDAATASVTLDNRDRAFDPISNTSVRPLNRIWLFYEFNGVVGSMFRGYVTAWQQEWPDWGGSDATATASAADEFSVLARVELPVTNPPRDSYAELIAVDGPVGYWDMNEDPTLRQYLPTDIASVPEPVDAVPAGLRRVERGKPYQRPRRR